MSVLSLLYQLHGGTNGSGSLLKELVDGLGLRDVVWQATLRLCRKQRKCVMGSFFRHTEKLRYLNRVRLNNQADFFEHFKISDNGQ